MLFNFLLSMANKRLLNRMILVVILLRRSCCFVVRRGLRLIMLMVCWRMAVGVVLTFRCLVLSTWIRWLKKMVVLMTWRRVRIPLFVHPFIVIGSNRVVKVRCGVCRLIPICVINIRRRCIMWRNIKFLVIRLVIRVRLTWKNLACATLVSRRRCRKNVLCVVFILTLRSIPLAIRNRRLVSKINRKRRMLLVNTVLVLRCRRRCRCRLNTILVNISTCIPCSRPIRSCIWKTLARET